MIKSLQSNLEKVIFGKTNKIELVLTCLVAGGHILLEDIPGVGKTILARALAASLGGDFKRIQFTPDLLPADITGTMVFNPKNSNFSFLPGPIFANVVLGDEINRASPRTQSAMLECMSERQVSIDGKTHRLNRPFFFIATENPVEYHGTYPLPEAQLDRFMMRLGIGYPDNATELSILFAQQAAHPLTTLQPIVSLEDLITAQNKVRAVTVSKPVGQYIVALAEATRSHADIALGMSTRGSIMLFRACQALAFIRERDHVLPDDVKALTIPVVAHRLSLAPKAKHSGMSKDILLTSILKKLPVPL